MDHTYAELHCHTSEVSACAEVSAVEAVRHFKEKGYDLVCITNHYKRSVFWRHWEKGEPFEDTVEIYLNTYRQARAEGERIGITVLPGAEITFDSSYNDYLVYGLTEQDFYEYPRMYEMTVEEFSAYARNKGWFFAQAHPFRNERTTRTDPRLIDGCEIYNSYENDNSLSADWARENDLIPLCGQDYHHREEMKGNKTALFGEVKDSITLIKQLKNRNYKLIINN